MRRRHDPPKLKTVLKYGVWDLFHIGHLNVIRFAANLGDFLVVAVATDDYIRDCRGADPIFSFHDRVAIISSLRMVDAVIAYGGLEELAPVETFGVDIIVVDEICELGTSAQAARRKKARELMESLGVRYVTVPRTPGISSSSLKESFK